MAPAAAVIPKEYQRHPGSPEPERVIRKVGPLECRFVAARARPDADRPEHVEGIPTVQSLAAVANRLVGAHSPLPRPGMSEPDRDERRKAMLGAKPTRAAAEGAVRTEKLRKPTGELYTKAELAPLVTLVRKQLVADLRASFKTQDRADRERQQREQQARARKTRVAQKARERALRKNAAAVLPIDARPTKTTSKDKTRPILEGAFVVKHGRGAQATWELVTTDSYQLTRYPLTIVGDPGLVEGMILGPDTLKRVEQAGGFHVTGKGKDQFIQPCTYTVTAERVEVPGNVGADAFVLADVPRVFDRGEAGKPLSGKAPDVKQLLPKTPAPTKTIELTFDAALLARMADATKGLAHVTLIVDERTLTRCEDGIRRPTTKPLGVRHKPDCGVSGILMPVRHNA